MNNTTTRALAAIIVLIFTASTLVGASSSTPTTAAFAYVKKTARDNNGNGNNNNNNGNTVTDQASRQGATESGFDNVQGQEAQNVICTHPNDNASCSQEGVTSVPTPIPTPQPTTGTLRVIKNVVCLPTDPNCAVPSDFTLTVAGNNPRPSIFAGQSGTGTFVTLDPGIYTVKENPTQDFKPMFSGQCAANIAAGQQLTCIVTNTETPTIQISGEGIGQNFCPRATVSHDGSITFSAQQIRGTVQGQFNMLVNFTANAIGSKSGTLNDAQISGSSFTVTGTEIASFCSFSQLPTSVTISGQCGTGVTIQYATADGEHATFIGNVACTT